MRAQRRALVKGLRCYISASLACSRRPEARASRSMLHGSMPTCRAPRASPQHVDAFQLLLETLVFMCHAPHRCAAGQQ